MCPQGSPPGGWGHLQHRLHLPFTPLMTVYTLPLISFRCPASSLLSCAADGAGITSMTCSLKRPALRAIISKALSRDPSCLAVLLIANSCLITYLLVAAASSANNSTVSLHASSSICEITGCFISLAAAADTEWSADLSSGYADL